MKTANQLLRELRLEAQKHKYVVFNICIRKAGIGVVYKWTADGDTLVWKYYPTLQKALEGEIKAWKAGTR